MKLLVFDLETAPIPNVEDFLGAIQAPANYTKQESIDKYIAEQTAKERDKAALDPDLCRIVALAGQLEGSTTLFGDIAQDEAAERALLTRFWAFYRKAEAENGGGVGLCGFNVAGFDVPVLLRRSLYLGVTAPTFRMGRYAYQRPKIVDLQDTLTMDRHERFKLRSKNWWMKRIGLPAAEDAHTGADVGTLLATGQWDLVLHHAKADVADEVALARWLGIWSA